MSKAIHCAPGSLAAQVVKEYNRVADALQADTGTNSKRLARLSDADLAWFSAGKRLRAIPTAGGQDGNGRIVDLGIEVAARRAIDNGLYHVASADARRAYVQLLTTSDPELDCRIDGGAA
ncbi:hypothetical protein IIA79_02505 [bacterium]|nr:hypothetical protein [bacterium]